MDSSENDAATAEGSVSSEYGALRDAALRKSSPRLGMLRVAIVAAPLVTIFGGSWLGGYSSPRLAVIAVLLTISLAIHAESAFALRSGRPARTSGVLQNVVHGAIVGAAGGLRGPLVALLLSLPVATVIGCGRSRDTRQMLTITGVILAALTVYALATPPPALHPLAYTLGMLLSLVVVLAVITSDAFGVVEANRRAGAALDRARQDVVAEMDARSRGLQSISSRVAHELKNPLAVIKSLTQLIAEGEHPAAAQRRFVVLRSEIDRMETILRDYLSFSRPLDDLEPTEVVVDELVDDVLLTLESRSAARSVRLERQGECGMIRGDRRRLKEALLNLVANAIEAETGPSGHRVTVRLARQADGAASLIVEDTGRGMSPGDLEKIGTPFFSSREGGTGLGVVLARGVIQQHGGELAYESQEGKGTRARVRIPASLQAT